MKRKKKLHFRSVLEKELYYVLNRAFRRGMAHLNKLKRELKKQV